MLLAPGAFAQLITGNQNTLSAPSISQDVFVNGAAPSITAGCNGAGVVQPAAGMSDLVGTFTGQTAAATTCTLTKSGSNCPNCFDCTYTDGGNATPAAFATSSCTNATSVTTFVSLAAAKIHYQCYCR